VETPACADGEPSVLPPPPQAAVRSRASAQRAAYAHLRALRGVPFTERLFMERLFMERLFMERPFMERMIEGACGVCNGVAGPTYRTTARIMSS
jgi:hypothetical protein